MKFIKNIEITKAELYFRGLKNQSCYIYEKPSGRELNFHLPMKKMDEISIVDRELASEEFERMKVGFDEHTLDNGVQIQSADRFGFVALDGSTFIGCSSGLAYKNDEDYSGWFYLTDLFVEKAYRSKGIGSNLLMTLEKQIKNLGIKHIWTWTAGYEAPKFYRMLGYEVFAEMEEWYSDGSSRVGFRKKL